MTKSLIAFFSIIFISITAHSAGITYNGNSEGHCTIWDKTIFGKSAKCRMRAIKISTGPVTCRFTRTYKDQETKVKFCVYNKQSGDKFTMSVGSTEICPVTFKCKK